MVKSSLLAASCFTLFLCGCAGTSQVVSTNADSPDGDSQPSFPASFLAKDFDGDGQITFEEWWEAEWQSYLQDDKDGDGKISKDEFIERMCGGLRGTTYSNGKSRFEGCSKAFGGWFSSYPLTKNSIKRRSREYFGFYDQNRDGHITPHEAQRKK